MAPPLDRADLHDHPWKGRTSAFNFRLPRRSRRATYACWAVVIFLLYLTLNSITSWPQVPSGVIIAYKDVPENEEMIPIRFPKLYSTLTRMGSSRPRNRNVLFIAENLEAASKLAGIACEMAYFRRNIVHLALLGSDDIEIGMFKKINGLSESDEDCRVFFHDARAMDAGRMGKQRKKIAVRSALRHLRDFIHPQAVMVDVKREEEWFLEIVREKIKQLEMNTIELPEDAAGDLRWITRLDSAALNAWHKPQFEIIVQANAHPGSLERLLKSIESAHYPSNAHKPTRLTIVLDPAVPFHQFTKSFLASYSFPSRTRISIRRPLAPAPPSESAKKFVESFYPNNEDTSLLLLDANTELSKWYYHYILWTTLEYRYSGYQLHDSGALLGVSLLEPMEFMNGTAPFVSPTKDPLFLYPVPNNKAALFFPKHWSEFHSFYAHALNPNPPARANITSPALSLSPELQSSFLAPYLSLIRARGYVMLHHSFPRESLAIVHTEPSDEAPASNIKEKPLMERSSFLDALPDADLPLYGRIPILDFEGMQVGASVWKTRAMYYLQEISTCPSSVHGMLAGNGVEDIFCDEMGKAW
ncbi:hypothetical protein RUND412_004042 [Rhizina undulata]